MSLIFAFDVCSNFDVILGDVKIDVGTKTCRLLMSVVRNPISLKR